MRDIVRLRAQTRGCALMRLSAYRFNLMNECAGRQIMRFTGDPMSPQNRRRLEAQTLDEFDGPQTVLAFIRSMPASTFYPNDPAMSGEPGIRPPKMQTH